jgi:hypothetical protein
MAEEKEFKAPKFKVKIDGKEKVYKITYPRLNIPGVGILTAEEAANNPEAVTKLITNGSSFIEEVEKGGE